jgi:mannosyltransferase OCH1-like enzyme
MIPQVLHQIWIQRTISFGYLEYWCLFSSVKRSGLPVILHTDLIEGQAGEFCPYKIPNLTIRQVVFSDDIKGVKAKHIAHFCDWYRINLLLTEGGVYSDIDQFWLSSIKHLCEHQAFACYQNEAYKTVANGVFGCSANDANLLKYKEAYQTSKTYWKSANMFKHIFASHWTILKRNTFYPWTNGKAEFLTDPEFKINWSIALGVQLWAHKYRNDFNFETTPLRDSFQDLKGIEKDTIE